MPTCSGWWIREETTTPAEWPERSGGDWGPLQVEPPCGHSTLIQVRMDTRLLLECRPEGRPRCAPWRLQHRPYTYKARNADFTR